MTVGSGSDDSAAQEVSVDQEEAAWSTEVVQYGPDLADESELRLLGDVRAKRILDLGCGTGHNAVALVKQGATVFGVEPSPRLVAAARRLSDAEDVRVDLRQGDLADLAFLRADSVDAVLAAGSLDLVADFGRVIRQVHRVLKVGAPLVLSLRHPASWLVDVDDDANPPTVIRSYGDDTPVAGERDGIEVTEYPRRFSDVYTTLLRASYRVDVLLEPAQRDGTRRSDRWRQAYGWVPPALILRARKEGN
jgi:SAM-dependent methyltransferase